MDLILTQGAWAMGCDQDYRFTVGDITVVSGEFFNTEEQEREHPPPPLTTSDVQDNSHDDDLNADPD